MKKRVSIPSELRRSSDSLRSTQDTPRISPEISTQLPSPIEKKSPLCYTLEFKDANHYLLFPSTQKTKMAIQKTLPPFIQLINQLWDLLTHTQPVPTHTIRSPEILCSFLKEISACFNHRDIELTFLLQKNQKMPQPLLDTLSNQFNFEITRKENVLNLIPGQKNHLYNGQYVIV